MCSYQLLTRGTYSCFCFRDDRSACGHYSPKSPAAASEMTAVSVSITHQGHLQVLGGRVETLAEAWEFQKRFGNIDRPTTQTNAEDQDQPPPFHRFVPGRKGRPPPLMVRSSLASAHFRQYPILHWPRVVRARPCVGFVQSLSLAMGSTMHEFSRIVSTRKAKPDLS